MKLTKIAKLSKSGCEILSFFDSACSSYPFRNTNHDWSRLKNRIETCLTMKEIERTKVCYHPDGSNRSADAIHFWCRRRGAKRKRRQQIDAWCGSTGSGVRGWASVKNKFTQLRHVHRIQYVVCRVIQRKCRSGTRRRSLNYRWVRCFGWCMNI